MKHKINDLSYLTVIWISALGLGVLQGCATQGKSLAMGGGIGAGAGAILGGIADPGRHGEYRTRNVVVGAAVGGMAGMVTGAILHDNTEEKTKEAYLSGQKSMANRPALPPNGPEVSQARVEVQWVEGRAVGNRWVDGHYERIITESSRWEAPSQ